jgi:lysozyme family protein
MSFNACIGFTLGCEGGFSMNPEDRGNWTSGEIGVGILKGTNFGLSAASYPHLNLRDLTPEAADAIYRRDYWQPVSGDELPAGLDLMVFDHAVNAGVGASVRLLQAALEVGVDGRIGPRTLLAARHADARGVILRLSQAQRGFYEAGAERVFRPGLIRRVVLRTDAALAMRGDGRANPEAVEPDDVGRKVSRDM